MRPIATDVTRFVTCVDLCAWGIPMNPLAEPIDMPFDGPDSYAPVALRDVAAFAVATFFSILFLFSFGVFCV